MGNNNQNHNQQRQQAQVSDVTPAVSNKVDSGVAAVAIEPTAEAQGQNDGLTEAEKREIEYARTRKHSATFVQPTITATSHELVRMLNPEPLDGVYIQHVHPFCVDAHEEKGWKQAPLDK